ncbi:MAG: energy transducer TonB [Lewinella sp.]
MKACLFLVLLCYSLPAMAQVIGDSLTNASDSIYQVVEQMPSFKADCPSDAQYKPCADKAMVTYVYEKLEYPEEAEVAGKEGMAVVSFVVEKDGTVNQASIYREPGYGMGEEALRVVESMNEGGPRWNPASRNGEPVRAMFNLPVKFTAGK